MTSTQGTGSNNLRLSPIRESRVGVRMVERKPGGVLLGRKHEEPGCWVGKEKAFCLKNPHGLHRRSTITSPFSLYYIPLIDSSHDTGWGPERQLSCENDA